MKNQMNYGFLQCDQCLKMCKPMGSETVIRDNYGIILEILCKECLKKKPCSAFECQNKAVVSLTVSGKQMFLCSKHWKESYD